MDAPDSMGKESNISEKQVGPSCHESCYDVMMGCEPGGSSGSRTRRKPETRGDDALAH